RPNVEFESHSLSIRTQGRRRHGHDINSFILGIEHGPVLTAVIGAPAIVAATDLELRQIGNALRIQRLVERNAHAVGVNAKRDWERVCLPGVTYALQATIFLSSRLPTV